MKKALLLEFERHHHETLASITSYFNQCGFNVDVFANFITPLNNSFDNTQNILFKRKDIKHPLFWLKEKQKFKTYDIIIVNTIGIANQNRKHEILNRIKNLKKTIFCIIHNTEILSIDPLMEQFFMTDNHIPIFLDDFLVNNSNSKFQPLSLAPVLTENFFKSTKVTPFKSEVINFAVQGHFDSKRRCYKELLSSMQILKKKKYPFMIHFLGNTNTPDGREFKKKINELKLTTHTKFFDQMLPFSTLYNEFSRMDFWIALLEPTQNKYQHSYTTHRHSGGLSLSLQFNVIPIIRSEFKKIYNWHKAMVLYENGHLCEVLEASCKLNSEHKDQKKNLIYKTLQTKRMESLQSLQYFFKNLGPLQNK